MKRPEGALPLPVSSPVTAVSARILLPWTTSRYPGLSIAVDSLKICTVPFFEVKYIGMPAKDTERRSYAGKSRTTILIADDHPLFRRSLRAVLENEDDIEVVGETANGVEAVRMADELHPDVVLMDISMPELDGLEATRQIKAKHPEIAVLVLTIHSDEQHAMEILAAGAAGYLTKSVFGEEIVHSIRGVIGGEMVLSPEIGKRLLELAARYPLKPVLLPAGDRLSVRELKILKLAACGMTNKEIASELGLSLRTTKRLLDNIFSILEVSSRTEAVLQGMRMGLLSMDDLGLGK
jgi:NarL family two-component system response regulator LiaR